MTVITASTCIRCGHPIQLKDGKWLRRSKGFNARCIRQYQNINGERTPVDAHVPDIKLRNP